MTTSYIAPDMFRPGPAAWPFGALAPQSYDLIMADPPWRFELYSEKGEEKSAQAHYATMTLDAIAALPVADLARPDCVLWLWCTAPMLEAQYSIARAWGFEPQTMGVWVKETVHGKLAFGTGYRLRNAHEPYVIATRGNPEPFVIATRGNPKTSRSVRSVVLGQVREHSRKPDEAYLAAETMSVGKRVRRCELFSRESRPGWDTWGYEAGKFDQAP